MSEEIFTKKEVNFYCLSLYFNYLIYATCINTINNKGVLSKDFLNERIFSMLDHEYTNLCKNIYIKNNLKQNIIYNVNYFKTDSKNFYKEIFKTTNFNRTFEETFLYIVNNIFKDMNIEIKDINNLELAKSYIFNLYKQVKSAGNNFARFVIDIHNRYNVYSKERNNLQIVDKPLILKEVNKTIAVSNIFQNLKKEFNNKSLTFFNAVSDKTNVLLKNEILNGIPHDFDVDSYVCSKDMDIWLTFTNYVNVLHSLNDFLMRCQKLDFKQLFKELQDGTFVNQEDINRALGE